MVSHSRGQGSVSGAAHPAMPYLVASGQGAPTLVPCHGGRAGSCHHTVQVQGLSLGDGWGRGLDADRLRHPCVEQKGQHGWVVAPQNHPQTPLVSPTLLTWHHGDLDSSAGRASGTGAHAEVDATISRRHSRDDKCGNITMLSTRLWHEGGCQWHLWCTHTPWSTHRCQHPTHLRWQSVPLFLPGDGGSGGPRDPAVEPHCGALLHLCPLWTHLHLWGACACGEGDQGGAGGSGRVGTMGVT